MSEINDLKKIVTKHEERISKLENTLKGKPKSLQLDEERVILGLKEDGFFDTPKRYKQIIKQLQTNAVFDKKGNYKNNFQANSSGD